jgi:hypothetical protein
LPTPEPAALVAAELVASARIVTASNAKLRPRHLTTLRAE